MLTIVFLVALWLHVALCIVISEELQGEGSEWIYAILWPFALVVLPVVYLIDRRKKHQ